MNFDLKFFWKLLLRRLPAMAALFLLCAGIGGVLAVKLPPTYTTTASLLVEAPQIPANLAASTVRGSAAEQLEGIRRRLMVRANLIDIANEFKVFQNDKNIQPDEVVAEMRQRTSIRSRGSPLVMTIAFSADDPDVAAAVVNEYVTLILEANVQLRTGQAEGTLDFFNQEVTRLNNELNLINGQILTFKSENRNSLPETLTYRQGQQTLLQQRLTRLERDLDATQVQRERIVNIYEETGRIQTEQQRQLTPEEKRLEQLQRELDSALVLYSSTNPRVRVLESQITKLQETITAQSGGRSGDEEASAQESLFQITLADFDTRLEDMETQITALRVQLQELEENIAATPGVGIALSTLQRDYASIQSQYKEAVNRRATASMGERIELSANGRRVTVVERAPVPREPSSPNRPMVAAAGVGGGLGAAAMLFLLLELINRTVRYPGEMISRTGITPLAVIPYMETALRRRLRRSVRVLMMLIVLIGVPAGLWAVDTYYRPLALIAQNLIERIGLG